MTRRVEELPCEACQKLIPPLKMSINFILELFNEVHTRNTKIKC